MVPALFFIASVLRRTLLQLSLCSATIGLILKLALQIKQQLNRQLLPLHCTTMKV